MGIMSFARPGLDPFGMWLAPGSNRSEWPSRVGVMGVGGVGVCHLRWLAHTSRSPEWLSTARIMKFSGFGLRTYEMWLARMSRQSK